MPERRRCRAVLAAVGVALVSLWPGLVVPVGAQTTKDDPPPPRWADSSFDAPYEAFSTEVRQQPVEISGAFRFQKPASSDTILRAEISLVDDPADDFEPIAGCELPPMVQVPGDGTTPSEAFDILPFRVSLAIECNGRYLLRATAFTNVAGNERFTMRRSLVVLVLPPPVDELEVTHQQGTGRTTVGWRPVPDSKLGKDAIGYLIERGGPSDDKGFGTYTDIRAVGLYDDPFVADRLPEPGTYSYRVRTLRHGPDGPVASSILRTTTAEVTEKPPPTTTTTTTAPGAGTGGPPSTTGPRVGSAIPTFPTRSLPSFGVPTTADTGFGETLDYGDQSLLDDLLARESLDELAAEDPGAGQSIVRDEGEQINMLIPAAGALVLVGWAGHLIYLNRLARQL